MEPKNSEIMTDVHREITRQLLEYVVAKIRAGLDAESIKTTKYLAEDSRLLNTEQVNIDLDAETSVTIMLYRTKG
jgi:hypothetical protein